MTRDSDRPPRSDVRTLAVTLDGRTGTVSTARDHARAFLRATRPPPDPSAVDDALIAISELVTNAVRHAPGSCTLRCTLRPDGCGSTLLVEVDDGNPALPQPRCPDLDNGGGGFGWHLLRSLARDLAVVAGPDGKTVRAVLPLGRGPLGTCG